MDYSKVQVDQGQLRKAQMCMVAILDEIDGVCERHNLKYWLDGGSALGAVRHKGFIPWDDDLDVAMMREDFEQFIKYAPQEFSDKLFIQTKETDKYYHRHIMRIRMNGTKVVGHDEFGDEQYHQGVFVDVFIFDYWSDFSCKLSRLFSIMPEIRSRRKEYPRGSWKRIVHGLLTAVPYALHRGFELLFLLWLKSIRKNSKLPLIGGEQEINTTAFYPKEMMLPPTRDFEFEGKHYALPSNPDAYLTMEYGEYMVLPPPEDRRTHSKLIEID